MIGVMMNTRALMELIVINIGFELGVIPKSVFFMLVFMAVASTYITTPYCADWFVPAKSSKTTWIRSLHVGLNSRSLGRF